MKVLILHQHFKTPQVGGAIRSYYLASALVKRGIKTVVITAHNERTYRMEDVEGIEVHYLPVPYDNRFGFYKRVFSFFSFAFKSVKLAAQHRDAILVYSISTPLTTGLAARTIKRRFAIPFIFEVGDLWPDAPVQMGFLKNPLVRNALYRIERLIYESASSIVALSEPIRSEILKKVPGKNVHVITNMSDTQFFTNEERRQSLKEKFGVDDKFVVSYTGALGVANGLHSLLDCAAATQREGMPVHFILCGDGAMLAELRRYSERLRLTNLAFLPLQDRNGIRDIMNVTDANFISYLPVKVLETGSPNKYFDGLAAGKLIIVNFGGWIRDEIESVRCGVYVDPKHPDDFIKKIRPFLADRALLKSHQQAARNLAERKYSRADLSERYLNILLQHFHK